MQICRLSTCANFCKHRLCGYPTSNLTFDFHPYYLTVISPILVKAYRPRPTFFWVFHILTRTLNFNHAGSILYLTQLWCHFPALVSLRRKHLCPIYRSPATHCHCVAIWPLDTLQVVVITPTQAAGWTLQLANSCFQYWCKVKALSCSNVNFGLIVKHRLMQSTGGVMALIRLTKSLI